jgi:hypothetical protein
MTAQAAPAAERAAGGWRRLRAAWRALGPEHRLAGLAALALLATMFLPWYSTALTRVVGGRAFVTHDNQTAIGAFSWVEAAVLLVALGVLALLFARGERRAFHLPGGDGAVVTAAGAWAALLIVWRLFDKPELGRGVSVGLAWGIFVALGAAIALALAGNRIRAARRPEPPLERGRRPPAGEAVEIVLPDHRPHLDTTTVMPERRRPPEGGAGPPRRAGPAPLSRETAAQDTAELRAASRDEAAESLQPGADERTEPLPPGDEHTEPLSRPADERTEPLPREHPGRAE